jgi:hypothetical protein
LSGLQAGQVVVEQRHGLVRAAVAEQHRAGLPLRRAGLAAEHPVWTVDLLGEPGRSEQTRPVRDAADQAAWIGDVRFLLVKESFGTAAAAVVLLVAVLAGAGREKRAEIDRLCADVPAFRRAFVLMSVVWGSALLLEAAVRVPLVYLLSPDVVAGLSVVLLLV